MNRWGGLPTRSESFEILPFGPPCATWGRWAKTSPLSTHMGITLEQALPFRRGFKKRKASLLFSGIILLRQNPTPKGGLP